MQQKREDLVPTLVFRDTPEEGWSGPDCRLYRCTRRGMIWSRPWSSEIHQKRDDLVPTIGLMDAPEEGWFGPDSWIQKLLADLERDSLVTTIVSRGPPEEWWTGPEYQIIDFRSQNTTYCEYKCSEAQTVSDNLRDYWSTYCTVQFKTRINEQK